jgi:hypothetical protein
MGFNPAEQIERIVSNSRSDFIDQAAQAADLLLVPLFALQMALRENSGLFDKFVAGKIEKSDIDASRQAVNIVFNDNPQTPNEEIATVVKVLNCLVPAIGTFSLSRWERQKRGAVTVSIAIIAVGPPASQRSCRQ